MTIYVRIFTLTILIGLLILSYKFYLSPSFTVTFHPVPQAPSSPKDITKEGLEHNILAEKAAQGDAEAQYTLGKSYESGINTEKNPKLAGYWFKQSANSGFEPSSRYLAELNTRCLAQTAITPDIAQGCIIAAGAGLSNAQKKLVTLYHRGIGVPQDDIEAFAWYITYAWPNAPASFRNGLQGLSEEEKIGLFIESKNSPYIQENKSIAQARAKEYAIRYSAR